MFYTKKQYLILFDIDGTILNMKSGVTHKLIEEIIRSLYNVDLPSGLYPRFAGRTDLFIIRKIAEMTGTDFKKIQQNIEVIFEKAAQVYEPFMTPDYVETTIGIEKLIKTLSQDNTYKLGLITGNFERNAYLKINTFDLGKYFTIGAFGNDHEDRNQLPLIAINRANKEARQQIYGLHNTLIVGDTKRDIECAHMNNLPVLTVATGAMTYSELSSYKPNLLFNDFSDTKQVLHSIKNLFGKN